jgi:hypothetical protein
VNWEALRAVAETAGAINVLATLPEQDNALIYREKSAFSTPCAATMQRELLPSRSKDCSQKES